MVYTFRIMTHESGEGAPFDYESLVDPLDLSEEDFNAYMDGYDNLMGRLDAPTRYGGSQQLRDLLLSGSLGVGVAVSVFHDGRRTDIHFVLTRQGWKDSEGDSDKVYEPEDFLSGESYGEPVPWFFEDHVYDI